MFEEYLCTYHTDELVDILKHTDKKKHYSLTIKCVVNNEKCLLLFIYLQIIDVPYYF